MNHLPSTENIFNFHGLRKHLNSDWIRVLSVVSTIICIQQSVSASDLYVNPNGKSGAYSTIGAAITQAQPGDTIYVAAGVYHEDVIIGKQLSIIGAGRGKSIINAVGLPNGIYIDGLDNPGLSKVVVTGFTVEKANFEGILITNASFVTIWENTVTHNDVALNPNGCTGQPEFETSETDDCGEGIHLIAVDHSTVGHNTSEGNSGGILITDETGPTHHNGIIGNLVRDNPFDCGITIASHPPAVVPNPAVTVPYGVYNNVVANNESTHNGYQTPGAGAGVGIFAPGPGNKAYANVVANNQLTNNGLPGVALHNHASVPGAPPANLNDNVIIGNRISGNGADTADAATPGPTGINIYGVVSITGTVISGNVIENESVDLSANTPAEVDVHFNDLLGMKIGVDNIGAGTVDATENWWGSPRGPNSKGATTTEGSGISVSPWLSGPIPAVQN
jgi:Right handed beta helix region